MGAGLGPCAPRAASGLPAAPLACPAASHPAQGAIACSAHALNSPPTPARPCPHSPRRRRPQEYITQAHELRDGLEKMVRQAGVTEPIPTPSGLPWFDLLAHPAAWKLNSSYLQGASLAQLAELGKMTSLEHRRHVVDPTLLGLHEVGPAGWVGVGRAWRERAPGRHAGAEAAEPASLIRA